MYLDFRYAMIINDPTYIEVQTERKIPFSQYRRIQRDYHLIQSEFEVYLKGYSKSARKKRIEKETLYQESSLMNFHKELGLSD